VTRDNAVTGNDIGIHVEVSAAVFDECIDFLEGTLVKQHLHALTCSHFASVVLSINPCLPPASLAAGLSISQILESLLCR
jgi:hypothetical protein